MSFYAVIAGTGPGIGRSTAIRFAKAYAVVLLARNPVNYESIVKEINDAGGKAIGVTADVADRDALSAALTSAKGQLPEGSKLAAAVFNVNGGFARKPFLELTRAELDDGLNSAVGTFYNFAQETLPSLLDAVPSAPLPPSLIITGATASVRGSALFGSFAAGKFALRALGFSLAREFGPKGVHVAHAIIDGVVDMPRTRVYKANGGVEDGAMAPDSIAETYWHLHQQHRSAFTFEVDLRPYVEKF